MLCLQNWYWFSLSVPVHNEYTYLEIKNELKVISTVDRFTNKAAMGGWLDGEVGGLIFKFDDRPYQTL